MCVDPTSSERIVSGSLFAGIIVLFRPEMPPYARFSIQMSSYTFLAIEWLAGHLFVSVTYALDD